MTHINRELKMLSKLLKEAEDLIQPDESLDYLVSRDIRDRIYGKKPACFMKLQPIGRDTSAYLFPVCNRAGMEDPKMIRLSIHMLQKAMTDSRFDPKDIQLMLGKLQQKGDTFLKKIPLPMSVDAKKAKIAKMFDNIDKYLTLSKTGTI
jgi:hypothetical protein